MFSRTIRRSIADAQSALAPRYALPLRARLSTVSHTLEPGNVPEPLINASGHKSNRTADYSPKLKGGRQTKTPSVPNDSVATPPAPSSAPGLPEHMAFAPDSGITPLSDSVREMLPLLQAQKPHYMVVHIHEKAYLVTVGDTVRLPYLMPDVEPGDLLRLNRATVLGSRDFTLRAPRPIKGTPMNPGRKMRWVDERFFVCRATVVGTESEPMRVKEKTKQRNRHIKHAKSKHKYTVLRISELTVRDVDIISKELDVQRKKEQGIEQAKLRRLEWIAAGKPEPPPTATARAHKDPKSGYKQAAKSGERPAAKSYVEKQAAKSREKPAAKSFVEKPAAKSYVEKQAAKSGGKPAAKNGEKKQAAKGGEGKQAAKSGEKKQAAKGGEKKPAAKAVEEKQAA